jgi:hypothetical protein
MRPLLSSLLDEALLEEPPSRPLLLTLELLIPLAHLVVELLV